jgi:hypothetical protein
VVGVHRLEDSLMCRLKLLQCEFPVAVSVHQTENYSHHGTRAIVVPVTRPIIPPPIIPRPIIPPGVG